MPRLTMSHFESHGILTAEEFVTAGDNLVQKYPHWQWASGEESRKKIYLPSEKQFLLLRGAPCISRVSQLEHRTGTENENAEWHEVRAESDEVLVDINQFAPMTEEAKENEDFGYDGGKIDDSDDSDEDDEEDDLGDPRVYGDESSVRPQVFIKTRRYDISICYDNFYRVPRVFLFGYSNDGSVLSHFLAFQDVMSDYQKKTVTVEMHPHLPTYMLSVHPCQHGNAMKKLIDSQRSCGHTVQVDSYMFLFLKLIQGVLPTIEYDHTMDVAVR